MIETIAIICGSLAVSVLSDDYQGQYLGKLNTYAHQASGDVYAIDEYTFLIKSFFYDGLGQGMIDRFYIRHITH